MSDQHETTDEEKREATLREMVAATRDLGLYEDQTTPYKMVDARVGPAFVWGMLAGVAITVCAVALALHGTGLAVELVPR